MFSEKYAFLAYGESLMSLIEDRCSIVENPYDVATYDVSLGLQNILHMQTFSTISSRRTLKMVT